MEVLDPCDLIACRTVVFGQLRFDDDMRIIFTWNDEIRRLVKARDTLGTFRFPVTDAGFAEHVLDNQFETIAN